MAWLAVNEIEVKLDFNPNRYREVIFNFKPERESYCNRWFSQEEGNGVFLPNGSIKKLIGKELTWNDEPIEY